MSVGLLRDPSRVPAPTSVRDTLYSLPPPNLPDTPATREDMAAFKASARSLDQGIGAVLNELHRAGLADDTLIVCTTDHGLAFPRAKATLFDRGTGVMLIDARARRVHAAARSWTRWSATSTSTRRSARSPASEPRSSSRGRR